MDLLTTRKRIDLIYGPPGSAKTTYLLALIKQLAKEKPGFIARAYVGDGSLSNYLDSGLVEAGFVEVLDYSGRKMPLTITEQMAEGWWAQDPLDPMSKMIQLTQEQILKTALWIYEGLSVESAYILGNVEGGLAYRSGRGEKIGQDSPIVIKDEGGKSFGGNPMSHYNVAQRHMQGCIVRTKRLPGMVAWTAHERISEDKVSAERVVGPELAGGALTPSIAREFNNTLHATVVGKSTKMQDPHTGKQVTVESQEYRLYTRNHYDPSGRQPVEYQAVCRTMRPDMVKEYYVSPITDPGVGLLEFYGDLARAKAAFLETTNG